MCDLISFIQKKTPRKVSLPFSVSFAFATPVMVSILMCFQITSLSGVSKRGRAFAL